MENAYFQKVRRFYVAGLSEGSEMAELSGTEFRHLKTVLRLKEGSEIVLFNGRGLEFTAIVESMGKGVAKARIISRKQTLDRSPVDIILFQAFLKGDKPEFIAQKATELG
ncbi:MAG: RsmE family RNA methyltransferase, partial [Deltaproteobacteria bacterium]